MSKLYFLLLTLFSSTLLIVKEAQTTHNLKIIVNDFGKIKGELRSGLTDKKEDFLKHCKYAKVVIVTNNSVSLEIANIKTGIYSISVFHDENNNGILDIGLFGIPSEPYAFSNNPSTSFGPPSFEKCTLLMNKDKQIYIEL